MTVPGDSDESKDDLDFDPGLGGGDDGHPGDVIDAIEALVEVLRQVAGHLPQAEAMAERAHRLHAGGSSYSEILMSAERPLLLELATMDLQAIAAAGTRLRRIGARALRDEGMSVDQMAREFGISRQRVARLLRADPDTPGPQWRKVSGG